MELDDCVILVIAKLEKLVKKIFFKFDEKLKFTLKLLTAFRNDSVALLAVLAALRKHKEEKDDTSNVITVYENP